MRVSGKAALEPVLPELGEPRVAGVGAEPELQEVVIKGGDLFGLQLHSDATHSLLFVSLHHLDSICPAVAAERSTLQNLEPAPLFASRALTLCMCFSLEVIYDAYLFCEGRLF